MDKKRINEILDIVKTDCKYLDEKDHEDLETILQSELKRMEGCEYCNEQKDLKEYTYNMSGDIEQILVTHDVFNKKDWALCIEGDEWNGDGFDFDIPIKFCPSCGS